MKLTAMLLTILLLFSLAVPAFAAPAVGTDVPIIHIFGQGSPIFNSDGENVYTITMPEEGVANVLKGLVPEFIDAMKLKPDDAWDFYYRRVRDVVLPCFGPFFLDKNGEASDGTHIDWTWNHGNLPNSKGAEGYSFDAYPFFFDWRLDPFDSADSLKDYIDDVKKATDSDKVNICARCEAANVLLAYFAKYGYDNLNCVEFLASAGRGIDAVSALFSGKISIDADGLVRYREQKLAIEDDLTRELVESLVVLSGDAMLLDVAAFSLDVFNLVLVNDKVIAPIVLETYGTMPGIWAMVDKEDYKAARRNLFGGKETEYANLLEKLDKYDREVRQRADELVADAKAAGVKVAVFAKYVDFQGIPIGKHADSIGDDSVNVTDASFGATAARYGKTLKEDALKKAFEKGTAKYISPDKMIDASTCVVPDTTWFIWGSVHKDFPSYLFSALKRFFDRNGDLTVFDDADFPQYLIAQPDEHDPQSGTLAPMSEESAPTIKAKEHNLRNTTWKEIGLRLLKALWNFLLRWLEKQ